MKHKRRLEREAHTTGMAPSGEAVAHEDVDGQRRALLVRGAAPDETVRVRFDPSERPARAELLEVIEAGPARRNAPCPYASSCGGCDWMHLSREGQREAHLALAGQLARGASLAFHEAPSALAYRVRARVHARKRRVGYFGARSHEIVEVDACAVLDPRVDAARLALPGIFEGARGEGEIALALGKDGLPVADVKWTGDLPAEVFARLERETTSRRFGGFRLTLDEARRPAIVGDPSPWIVGADGAPLELEPGGFSQANEAVNRALAARVAQTTAGAKNIVELYAGAGNFSVLLARAATLRAVESSEGACEAARRNLAARGLDAKVTCADAGTFEIPGGVDVVVLDPPRTGAREACERLAKHKSVRRVVYVSCDRATLARDAALLAPRFSIASVDVFEMFPNTSHAETVALFERGRS